MIRVALHAHSNWSYDGHWRLKRIAQVFGVLGFDAVMMTEHDTGFDPQQFSAYRSACREASSKRCTLIPGIEYSSPDNAVHILTWGLDQFLAEHRPTAETLAKVTDAGGAAIFAHPVRRQAFLQFDHSWTTQLHGIELWNRKSDGLTYGREAFDLVRRTGLPATVGIDFHRLRHLWPLSHRFETVSRGDDLEERLVHALRHGAHRPDFLGRAILDAEGSSISSLHDRFDRTRLKAVNVLRLLSTRR